MSSVNSQSRIAGNEDQSKPQNNSEEIELSCSEIGNDNDPIPSPKYVPVRSSARGAQLNSSIFVGDAYPLDKALQAIDAAAERGERQLNVVVTILVDLTQDLRIKSYSGYDRTSCQYKPFDRTMRTALRNQLRQVFAHMAKHGMAIYILPHIDAGGEVRTWRNWVNFDPLETCHGFTYADLMLCTITDALEAATDPDTHIELALSGEMGTSLFRYPESYRAVMHQLRGLPKLKQLKLGISLNHDGIAGKNNPNGARDIALSDTKRAQMQGLINDCDFVAMSYYAPFKCSPTPGDFTRGIDRFMAEFKQLGLTVPTTKHMHFSEVAIGGGQLGSGEEPDPVKAAQSPWEGTDDPSKNPWRTQSMRKLRRQFHTALLQFLTQQPAPWRVSAAFLWSMGSWDPVSQRQHSFADLVIITAIDKHNRAIPGAGIAN